MLEKVHDQRGRRQVFRLARIPAEGHFAAELGLDAQGWEELKRLVVARRLSGDLDDLCDAPFRLKRRLRNPTRFSDGSFPVFYSSLDAATAEAEVRHWLPRYIGRPQKPRTTYYQRFSCTFDGTEKDLRPRLAEWPNLIHGSDYGFCNQLGAEAVRLGVEGLVVPSARRSGGANQPVFKRQAISNPKLEATLAITYYPDTGSVFIESRAI